MHVRWRPGARISHRATRRGLKVPRALDSPGVYFEEAAQQPIASSPLVVALLLRSEVSRGRYCDSQRGHPGHTRGSSGRLRSDSSEAGAARVSTSRSGVFLGAALIGASRAAANAGWRAHTSAARRVPRQVQYLCVHLPPSCIHRTYLVFMAPVLALPRPVLFIIADHAGVHKTCRSVSVNRPAAETFGTRCRTSFASIQVRMWSTRRPAAAWPCRARGGVSAYACRRLVASRSRLARACLARVRRLSSRRDVMRAGSAGIRPTNRGLHDTQSRQPQTRRSDASAGSAEKGVIDVSRIDWPRSRRAALSRGGCR